VWHITTQA